MAEDDAATSTTAIGATSAADRAASGSSTAPAATSAADDDDWEMLAGEQVHQLTSDRLKMLEQAQRSAEQEQKCLSEPIADSSKPQDPVLPLSQPNKPIRLLKREQPRLRKPAEGELGSARVRKPSESELDSEARRLQEQLTLDERKANYDKIRERIFNVGGANDAVEEAADTRPAEKPLLLLDLLRDSTQTSSDMPANNEVLVETINHLTYVQMLSDHTPASMRQTCASVPIQQPPPPPPLIPAVRIQPGLPPQRLPMYTMHSMPPPLMAADFPPLPSHFPQSAYPRTVMHQQQTCATSQPTTIAGAAPLRHQLAPQPLLQLNAQTAPKKRMTNKNSNVQQRK